MGQRTPLLERETTFRASDGATIPAFCAEPGDAPAAPRLAIAPEIFGLSPFIRSVARRLAREGFRAIAPEIFARDPLPEGGSDRGELLARMGRLSLAQAVSDLHGALAQLRGGLSGVIGFCLGGSLALLTAAESDLRACVDCYGRIRLQNEGRQPIEAAPAIACPVLGVYGRRDAGIPVADAEALRAALPKGSEVVLYDAGHAFLNDQRPDLYAPDQAELAWPKIVGFLRRHLG